ncbi:MAG: dTDP-4-dehydrorhamnose reductase [Alphaproteobacteria bacterium]|nr:dTDP-4-dehydrorhamnose reductase [Alphaproteobacteria bacterium]
MSGELVILGAEGQVGREVAAAARRAGRPCRAYGHGALDIADARAIDAAITGPATIVNCAAYTAVDRAESEPALAQRANAYGPGLIAARCAAVGAILLHLSTDYVFDGSGDTPRDETAPVAPLNAYGRSKADGEAAIRRSGARHVILRVSWVFGAAGMNFVRTMRRLRASGREIRVVDDVVGGPTPAAAIAEALLAIHDAASAPRFDGWGTYHFAGTPDTTWFDFARRILADTPGARLAPVASRDYPQAAPRPRNCRLDCARIAARFGIARPRWEDHLPAVIAAQREAS